MPYRPIKNYSKWIALTFLLAILCCHQLQGQDNQTKTGWRANLNGEVSTLPVVGMFPYAGNVRNTGAQLRGELVGGTINYSIVNESNNDYGFQLDASVSAHLLGVNWGQLFSDEKTSILDIAYLRLGLSVPRWIDRDETIRVRFQGGFGRVLFSVPEITRTGFQSGFDISFSMTYKLF